MTGRDHRLSLSRQADLLGISRASLYCAPPLLRAASTARHLYCAPPLLRARPTSEDDLKPIRRIDELHIALHMEYPVAGNRMMKGLLRQEGLTAGRLHMATCMKRMGIQALPQAEHVETGARPQGLSISS